MTDGNVFHEQRIRTLEQGMRSLHADIQGIRSMVDLLVGRRRQFHPHPDSPYFNLNAGYGAPREPHNQYDPNIMYSNPTGTYPQYVVTLQSIGLNWAEILSDTVRLTYRSSQLIICVARIVSRLTMDDPSDKKFTMDVESEVKHMGLEGKKPIHPEKIAHGFFFALKHLLNLDGSERCHPNALMNLVGGCHPNALVDLVGAGEVSDVSFTVTVTENFFAMVEYSIVVNSVPESANNPPKKKEIKQSRMVDLIPLINSLFAHQSTVTPPPGQEELRQQSYHDRFMDFVVSSVNFFDDDPGETGTPALLRVVGGLREKMSKQQSIQLRRPTLNI